MLIGDAAHTMTPTGAFGVNAALEDAYQLSLLLQELASSQYSTREKLKDLQARRVSKVIRQLQQQLQMETEFPGRIKSFM
ncbi:FAD-dependent monooxygenase [Paenibacillus provencensis]|uniref:FAD-dependent monooxygenase n=1 Tax=Paenibacillus provencensis TaxID=441151 RepID=A0ABW3PVB8_9BACL